MEEMTILTWLALLLFYLVIKDSKFLFEDDIEYLTLSNGTLMFKSWLILNYARLFSFFKIPYGCVDIVVGRVFSGLHQLWQHFNISV